MIELKNVSKSFGLKGIFNNLNYTFANTGLYILTGESGIGKTTLLNLLSFLDDDYTGSILYNNKILTPQEKRIYANQKIAIFNQELLLSEELNVWQNLSLFTKDETKIDQLLNEFDLSSLKYKSCSKLSQGEKKRIVFIRTLLKPAEIYLFDEPTSFLDEKNKQIVLTKLKELSSHSLVIMVSHEAENMNFYADKILQITNQNIIVKQDNAIISSSFITTNKEYKLPFSSRILLAQKHLIANKKKNTVTILVFFLSMIFLLFGISCLSINADKIHYEALNHEKSYDIYLTSNKEDYNIENINSQNIISKGYFFDYSSFEYEKNEYQKYPVYYENIINYNIRTLEYQNENIELLIGHLPTYENEIIISQLLADQFIKKGIKTVNNQFYYPKTYENILNMPNQIVFGNVPVKVIGIAKNPSKYYDDLYKNVTLENLTSKELHLFEVWTRYYLNANIVYTTADFANYVENTSQNQIAHQQYFHIQTNEHNLKQTLNKYEKDKNVTIRTIATDYLNEYQSLFKILKIVGFCILILIISFITLNMLYFYKNTISNHNEEICLLKENGIKTSTILSIYTLELSIITGISFCLSLIFYILASLLANNVISNILHIYFPVLTLPIYYTLLMILVMFLLVYFLKYMFNHEINTKKLKRIEE